MQAGPWASYTSFVAVAASSTATVNCRAIWCNAAGTLTIQQNVAMPNAPAAVSFTVLAGQIVPFELDQGLITACPAGTVALA